MLCCFQNSWMIQIREAKRRYNKPIVSRENSLKEEDIVDNNNRESFKEPPMDTVPSNVRRRSGPSVKRIQHGKSLSVDAIFL